MIITDPIKLFESWLDEAKSSNIIKEPTAMALATATRKGKPSVRIVLAKAYDKRGFAFFTNMKSRKGRELKKNPNASLCFYWMPLLKQVRIYGKITKVGKKEADKYFASRSRESQIGAWASAQSEKLSSRKKLEDLYKQFEKKFEGKEITRPPHWSGYRLIPNEIEFWEECPHRLHDRTLYTKKSGKWKISKLFP